MLGFETYGTGDHAVVVLNDWLCDTSTWDGARAYLDGAGYTWHFADLRGYGRSRGQAGSFTLEEAVADVLALGPARFSVVGHSMSSLVAMHLAQHHGERLRRCVLVSPTSPSGTGAPPDVVALIQAAALGDDATRAELMGAMWGERLGPGWLAYKMARWRATAEPAAVAAYVSMFAVCGLPAPSAPLTVPTMALTGEQDVLPMRAAAVATHLAPLRADLVIEVLADSGHYPMQEVPPLTAAAVQRFLDGA